MTISALPTAPQRTDPPDTFATRADAWVAALSTWTTQVNALAVDVDADAATATTQAGIATTQAALATTNGSAQVALAADQVSLAADQVSLATTQANNAAASAVQAASSAATAVNAPGTSATSSTSLTIETGNKTLTVNSGKNFVFGMNVMVSSNTVSCWMHGEIISYNSTSGELIVNVSNISGSGTYSSWTISLSAPTTPAPTGISLFDYNNFI